MKYRIEQLSKEHLPMIDVFSCVETENMLSTYNSKMKRRIRRHSLEMDNFIKYEALLEQSKGLNTTHVLIENQTNTMVAFISLCNDSLTLVLEEVEQLDLKYKIIPTVKIARLGVDIQYRNNRIGKFLICYSAILISYIKEYAGVAMVTLDCYVDKEEYYKKLGFIRNSNQPLQLHYDTLISLRITLDALINSLVNEFDLYLEMNKELD